MLEDSYYALFWAQSETYTAAFPLICNNVNNCTTVVNRIQNFCYNRAYAESNFILQICSCAGS